MELSELNELWKNADEKLGKSISVNKKLLHEVTAGTIRKTLAGIKWNCIIEIILSYFFFDFLAGFAAENYSEMKFLLPAAFLMLLSILGIALGIYKLIIYYRIRPETPVLKTQKFAAELNYLERLEINMLYWMIPLFWTAFLIVFTKELAGFDIYTAWNFLIYQTIGSFVVGFIIIFLLKKFPDRKLKETINFLNEIRQNENK